MIVEFVGGSGAGKTTLILSVQRHLSELGIICHPQETYLGSYWKKPHFRARIWGWRDLGLAVLTQPRLAVWCFTQAPKLYTNVSFRTCYAQQRWLLGASYYAKRFRLEPGVHLHDEGPLKVAAAIAGRNPSSSSLEALVAHVSLPDLLVALTVDPNVAAKRVRQRGDNRTPSETIERWAANHNKGVQVIAKWSPTFVADTSNDEDYGKEIARIIAVQYQLKTQ